MPKESKQAKRSTALAKQLHLEAIGIDWQHKLNQLSIANFDPSWDTIAKHTWNQRAAEVHWTFQKTLADHGSVKLLSKWASELVFHLWHVSKHMQLIIAHECKYM